MRLWPGGEAGTLNSSEVRILYGHSEGFTVVSWAPDGGSLASVPDDATVRLRLADGERIHGSTVQVLDGHTGRVLSKALSPDGTGLDSSSSDGTARVWPVDQVSKAKFTCSSRAEGAF